MEIVTFATDRLVVRPWRADDVAWYCGAMDSDVLRWTREDHVPTAREWLRTHTHQQRDEPVQWAAVVRADDDRLVGSLGIERLADVAEISYWIAAAERHRGYATEALAGASAWVHGHHGALRQELQIHPDNAASIAVAEACGFEFDRMEATCRSCADAEGRVTVYVRDV